MPEAAIASVTPAVAAPLCVNGDAVVLPARDPGDSFLHQRPLDVLGHRLRVVNHADARVLGVVRMVRPVTQLPILRGRGEARPWQGKEAVP